MSAADNMDATLQTLVDQFESIDNNHDKKRFMEKLVVESCEIVGKPAATTTKKKKSTGRQMNGWICYNKVCAKETDRSYMECVQDAGRKEEKYEPKKDYWKQEAKKGCPRANE
jgi:predicted glycosyltransferase